jgi:protein gp37
MDHLKAVDAKVHFLSLEPLLGPIGKLDLEDIEWVTAGDNQAQTLESVSRIDALTAEIYELQKKEELRK